MIPAIEVYNQIKDQLKAEKPFVIYRKPEEELSKAILQVDKEVYFGDGLEASGFVFAPFKAEEEIYLIPSEKAEIIEFQPDNLEDSITRINSDPDVFDFGLREEDQKVHETLVQKGIDAIKAGEFMKVVLARSEKVDLADPDPIRIFKALLNTYKSAFVYIWYHPRTGIWMGATPETLISTDRTNFRTMALAGTQLYKGDEDVSWRKKEIEEQELVSDYILKSLQNLDAVRQVSATNPFTSRAGNLLHIRTNITGQMKSENNVSEIVKSLHPTPAICGLPKDKALEFILKNEAHPRDYYSGYLGEINFKTENKRNSNRKNQENQQFTAISNKTDLYVNLRCMKMKDGNAIIYVGGGITKDSHAGEEWMETVNKSQTMRAALIK